MGIGTQTQRKSIFVAADFSKADVAYITLEVALQETYNIVTRRTVKNVAEPNIITDAALADNIKKCFVMLILFVDSLSAEQEKEIRLATAEDVPCIVVNLSGNKGVESSCPQWIKGELILHISFITNVVKYAIEYWPAYFKKMKAEGKTGSCTFSEEVYENER